MHHIYVQLANTQKCILSNVLIDVTFTIYTPDVLHLTDFYLIGYYIVTPRTPGSWEKKFRIYSLPLTPAEESMCLQFWLVFIQFISEMCEIYIKYII